MQENDAEVINRKRKRRKRIARIKTGIITIVSGWILLSMILIAVLCVQVFHLGQKLDDIAAANPEDRSGGENVGDDGTAVYAGTETADTQEVLQIAEPPAVGIDEADNLASDGDTHMVYLTFEDGPSERTDEILDILAEYDVKATFFVTGSEDGDAVALYKRIADEGHTLGMHSYSNKYSVIYQSMDAFAEDFTALRDALYEATGVESVYYRFPGASSNQVSNVPMLELISYLNGEGVVYYDWNVSAGDAASNACTAEEIVTNVMEGVEKYKTSVVLLHDSEDQDVTVEALAPLIEALEESGAEILPIDEDTPVIQYVKADGSGEAE